MVAFRKSGQQFVGREAVTDSADFVHDFLLRWAKVVGYFVSSLAADELFEKAARFAPPGGVRGAAFVEEIHNVYQKSPLFCGRAMHAHFENSKLVSHKVIGERMALFPRRVRVGPLPLLIGQLVEAELHQRSNAPTLFGYRVGVAWRGFESIEQRFAFVA
jgi:hypothetical protein